MKNLYFLIVSITMIITSCEPPIVTTFGCTDKRIRNIEDASGYSRLLYDDEGRQIEKKLGLVTAEIIDYETGSVKYKSNTFDINFITDDTILPDQELISSGTYAGGTFAYTHNAAGNLLTFIDKQGTVTNTSVYTWVAGNLMKVVTTRSSGSPAVRTTTYTYNPTIINSTSSDFKGLKVFGKQSFYAPKTMTVTATGQATVITNYTYQTNECGCITNATVQTGASTSNIEYTYEKISN